MSSMSYVVEFVVPGQPQGKGRARSVSQNGRTRHYTPAKTLAYERLVRACAYQVEKPRFEEVRHAFSVHIVAVIGIPASWSSRKVKAAALWSIRPKSRPDTDNIAKSILDGCNGVIWADDAQVVDLQVQKFYGPNPHVSVRITRIDEETAL